MARVGRATDGGSGNSGGSVNGAPARKRLSTGNTGSAGRAGQVRKEIRRLTQLEEVWWPVALEGNKEATDRVLAIQKQRLVLFQQLADAKDAEKAEASGNQGPVEARIVFVDDWRTVRK